MSWPGWAGVAAIAQVIAAIGTVGTLIVFGAQLSILQRQYKEDRERAATPLIWIEFNNTVGPHANRAAMMSVHLRGAGFIRHARLRWISPASFAGWLLMTRGILTYEASEIAAMQPGEQVQVEVAWNTSSRPIEGRIAISFFNAENSLYNWAQKVRIVRGQLPEVVGTPLIQRAQK